MYRWVQDQRLSSSSAEDNSETIVFFVKQPLAESAVCQRPENVSIIVIGKRLIRTNTV
jgi:hypothetical protein